MLAIVPVSSTSVASRARPSPVTRAPLSTPTYAAAAAAAPASAAAPVHDTTTPRYRGSAGASESNAPVLGDCSAAEPPVTTAGQISPCR